MCFSLERACRTIALLEIHYSGLHCHDGGRIRNIVYTYTSTHSINIDDVKVHRDLAARNVLIATGMVAKVRALWLTRALADLCVFVSFDGVKVKRLVKK